MAESQQPAVQSLTGRTAEKIEIDTLVVGAGQAGVAMSEHLTKLGVPHLVLEKNRIAEAWRTGRWDSLVANGPVWHDRFPGMEFDLDPDAFAPKDTIAAYFEAYAKQFNAPIRTGVEVKKVTRNADRAGFTVETSIGVIQANRVVSATGPFQRPVIPAIAPQDQSLYQIHSAAYYNPEQLPEGGVLVVGAGSAGCVLANRLSANPSVRVCLIEAGGSDASPRVQTPAGTITLYKSKVFSWNYFSTPQKHLAGRSLHTPRGKALGGSSSMNSMIYIRGDASDYDRWEAAGCPGWGWQDVLPYFKQSEGNRLGQSLQYHGTQGELLVDKPRDPSPLSERYVRAAQHLGLARNDDFNGGQLDGVGIYNVTQKNAKRLSSYRAFVHPVRQRSNLTVLTGCEVERLLLDGGCVTGVELRQDGQWRTLHCARETMLCAGALGSPHILLKSGIGPQAELEAAGVACKVNLPGVGKNLQDHIDGLVTVRSKSSLSLGFSLGSLPKVLAAPFQYLASKMGWLTTNYVEAGGFARTPLAQALPDVQMHFVPGYRSHRGRLFEWGHGYAVHTCVLRPKSIGEVRLGAGRSLAIDFNFFANPEDARVLVEGVKLARQILAQPEFDELRGAEMLPGPQVQTDEQLLAHLRDYAATVFHPVGTCKMGTDDLAVVTPELKVRGVANLRVADASIMPTLISGNTNAPCIMIGERAAAWVRGETGGAAVHHAAAQCEPA